MWKQCPGREGCMPAMPWNILHASPWCTWRESCISIERPPLQARVRCCMSYCPPSHDLPLRWAGQVKQWKGRCLTARYSSAWWSSKCFKTCMWRRWTNWGTWTSRWVGWQRVGKWRRRWRAAEWASRLRTWSLLPILSVRFWCRRIHCVCGFHIWTRSLRFRSSLLWFFAKIRIS